MIIGLHGSKGSGKDYFYKIAAQKFGSELDVRKIAYADPIRIEVSKTFDLTTEAEYDAFKRTQLHFSLPNCSFPDRIVDGRTAVRSYGMMMRSFNENQFVEYVETEVMATPSAVWCITDLRFQNEIESIRRLGGYVVKILRTGFEYDGHVTETEFDDSLCDIVLDNNDTIEGYEQLVCRGMHWLLDWDRRHYIRQPNPPIKLDSKSLMVDPFPRAE